MTRTIEVHDHPQSWRVSTLLELSNFEGPPAEPGVYPWE
jgi:hypothetical protein